MPKTKKVRIVKSVDLGTVLEKAKEIPVIEENELLFEDEIPTKIEKTAIVKLTEASTLIKDGKTYIKNRTFTAIGEVQVNYYKKDSRFTVIELK